jgi:fimbrial isopeptide formation D2 family protein/fibro-slime domain-containing protein/LPXTG-motif cell wall-anchored protein
LKYFSKSENILKARFLPMLLAVLIVASTLTVAFSVTAGVDASAATSTDFAVPVGTKAQSQAKDAFWVDATYFDYLSDQELQNGWLKPTQAGTGYNGSEDNWYPFYQFNRLISSNVGNWTHPLYFGNFCNNHDAYPVINGQTGERRTHGGPYDTAKQGLANFNYLENNSNALVDYHTSVKGLADTTLQNGDIKNAAGNKMIYFDAAALGRNAKTISSSFPFRSSKNGKVTTYSFDSQGAKDNVFFEWDGTTPKSVNYGQGTTYGVQDALKYFMNPDDTYSETGKPYKDGTYYGIYPFNNSAATKGSRGGNDNLDHGFGIKMDMDFKVPKDGLLDDGSPVKFTYTGDDDLWVYISKRDGSNSQLVLDLGGNHKKASGTIDFSKMEATASKTAHVGDTNNSRGIYIYDKYNWGGNMKVHAWGNGHGGEWYDVTKCNGFPEANGENGSKVNVYYVSADANGSGGTKLSDMDQFAVCKAKDDWSETPKKDGTDDAVSGKVSEHINMMTYPDNPAYTGGGPVIPQVDGKTETETTNFGFAPLNRTQYQTLDENEVYHMTIFYMERGLIESNCSMAFTMTPAQNEVAVTKEVKYDGLNGAITDAVGDELKNEEFNFAVTDGTKEFDAKLKDGENTGEDLNNKYATGSKLKVTESYNSNFTYKTSWQVVDLTANENVVAKSTDNADSKATDEFELKSSTSDLDPAKMRADFVNTVQAAPLTIEKNIIDSNNQASNDTDDFTFTMKVDLKGGTDYKAYPLYYSTDATNAKQMSRNGEFTFNSSDKVTVVGLPVGATYQITETDKQGYTAAENPITGKIAEGDNNKASFTNKQDPTEPPTTVAPTTAEPTTAEPTTAEPTTAEPTTAEPTTAEPTTEEPTEPPTTVAPTTAEPTTVAPTTEAPTTEPVTEPATEVEPTPEINKKIVNSKYTDLYSTAAMQEKVTFALTSKVTGTATRKLNGYTIVDTMSEGFTFDKIKSVTLDGKKTLTDSQYKVKKTDEGFDVDIDKSVLSDNDFYSYKDVIVTYTATLNKDAVVGSEGNPNSDSLKWIDADGKAHEKDGNEVVVYTFQIDVNKVDSETDDPLKGAQFAVYSSEDDAKNGKNAIAKATSDEEGLASFVGLDKGTYYVKETKTIKGYNLNTKVYSVKIEPKFSDGELESPDDGIVEVTIKNTPAKLPKTGMVPTMMFTGIGAMLIGGAIVLFLIALRKKKYSKYNH